MEWVASWGKERFLISHRDFLKRQYDHLPGDWGKSPVSHTNGTTGIVLPECCLLGNEQCEHYHRHCRWRENCSRPWKALVLEVVWGLGDPWLAIFLDRYTISIYFFFITQHTWLRTASDWWEVPTDTYTLDYSETEFKLVPVCRKPSNLDWLMSEN